MAAVSAVVAALASACAQAAAGTLPPGFRETTALRDLNLPMAARFAPDGRVFVAEKSGIVKVFDSVADTTPTTFADLRTNVHNFHDRGLLGFALDPAFPAKPYAYVLYTHDAVIGGTAPRWGTPGATSDGCPTPPGETADGCVVSGRLSRLTAAGDVMVGAEKVLVEDWCNQYPSHGMGSIAFDAGGWLIASSGDGAAFGMLDYGQDGSPLNPCGDPPGGVGATLTPPTAEGGSLRSQDVRTSGDPAGLNGTLIRVDPATGAGAPGNPFAASGDPNLRRIIAYGLRNPFRTTVRPGTNEIWAADVGLNQHEEIDRVPTPADASAENFGWPCYEGAFRQPAWESTGMNICKNLYAQPGAETRPYFSYAFGSKVVPGEGCPTGNGSSLSGLAFYPGGPYPDDYDGALFFGDFSRNCLWVMKRAGGSLPSPAAVSTFIDGASYPVDLVVSPTGELFYVGIGFGQLQRIEYEPGNGTPVAVANATPRSGLVPLTVRFDSAGSHDPDAGDAIALAWDLDGDGAYDDATDAAPSWTYVAGGPHTASLQVTDEHGASSRASVTVVAGDTAPRAEIIEPDGRHKLEGRRHDRVLRSRPRCRAGHAAGNGAEVVDPPASLRLRRLSRPQPAGLRRRRVGLVRRSRPRVPVLSRARPDRDRRAGRVRREEPAPGSQDRDAHDARERCRPEAHAQRLRRHDAVRPHRHPGFEQLGERAQPADRVRTDVDVPAVVGPRCADAQRHRGVEHGARRRLPVYEALAAVHPRVASATVDLSEPPELAGVEHRYVEVRGARLHVADSGGSGPPVLLLHGWPQHWWTWHEVISLLAPDFRVLALDLRGFGWSEATKRGYRKDELAEDVVGVLDALGLDAVNLVGHDWGGVIGFIVCVEHPDRVLRYVPMNTGHLWPRTGVMGVLKTLPGLAYQVLLASPGIGHRIGASPKVLGAISKKISTRSDVVMGEIEQFSPRFRERPRARAAQQVYRTFLLHDYPAQVRGRFADKRLTTPTLWLNGAEDPVYSRGAVESVQKHADDVRFEELPDCGHFPPQERPDLVAEQLRAFFSE